MQQIRQGPLARLANLIGVSPPAAIDTVANDAEGDVDMEVLCRDLTSAASYCDTQPTKP